MRIILNSDVLHSRLLGAGLVKHIEDFCHEASQSGAILVLPRTVVLENERHQRTLYEAAIAELKTAAETLIRRGISLPSFVPEDLIDKVDIVTALRATGVTVEIESPLLEDYQDAERRASLHLSPQIQDAKSDEMRDLVIWAIALRIASRDEGAILVSRDEVHVGARGEEEAAQFHLLRAKTLDEALDYLGRMSPTSALAQQVLGKVWGALRAGGLPVPDDVPGRRFLKLRFAADEEGYANMQVKFEISIAQGKLRSDAFIFQSDVNSIRADLTDISMNERQWNEGRITVQVDGQLPRITSPAAARMADLRSVIEGDR